MTMAGLWFRCCEMIIDQYPDVYAMEEGTNQFTFTRDSIKLNQACSLKNSSILARHIRGFKRGNFAIPISVSILSNECMILDA